MCELNLSKLNISFRVFSDFPIVISVQFVVFHRTTLAYLVELATAASAAWELT